MAYKIIHRSHGSNKVFTPLISQDSPAYVWGTFMNNHEGQTVSIWMTTVRRCLDLGRRHRELSPCAFVNDAASTQ